MPTLADIRTLLTAQTLVEGATGWACKLGTMPSTPDQCVGLFETGGPPPEPTPGTTPKSSYLTYPVLQVRVRGAVHDYAAARAKLQEVFEYLHSLVDTTVGSATYLHILALSDALPIGDDEAGRPEITQNFQLAREE